MRPSLHHRIPSAVLLAIASVAAQAQAAQPTPELLWETSGFSAPESIVLDTQRGQYYVSNMATRGEGATPGDGFISRVAPDGTIIELKWITGLENPKGLSLANGRLYVGDDDALLEIDLDAGAVIARHAPEDGGPGQFNDSTADAAGNVYVFSSRLDTIYRLSGGTFAPWVKVDTQVTGKFNGLRADGERLLAGSWRVPAPDGEQPGHLTTFDLADGRMDRIGSAPIGHIDGIEPDGQGGWIITDFTPGRLLHVTPDGEVATLLTLSIGTADIHYRPDQQLLLLPRLRDDMLQAWRWAPASRSGE